MTPFQTMQATILDPIKSNTNSVLDRIQSEIGPALTAAMIVYVMFFGWQIIRGESQEPVQEFVKRCIKLGVIAFFVLNIANYRYYVVETFAEELPNGISRLFSGDAQPNANQFDTAFNHLGVMVTKMWKGASWSDSLRAAVFSFATFTIGAITLAAGFIVVIWAKAGAYFVLALGPIFIALAMFDQTRKYLHSFLDTVITFAVMQILVSAVVGLVVNALVVAAKTDVSTANVVSSAGNLIVVCIFANAMWLLLPQLSSKLGGYGVSFSHKSPVASAGQIGGLAHDVAAGNPAGTKYRELSGWWGGSGGAAPKRGPVDPGSGANPSNAPADGPGTDASLTPIVPAPIRSTSPTPRSNANARQANPVPATEAATGAGAVGSVAATTHVTANEGLARASSASTGPAMTPEPTTASGAHPLRPAAPSAHMPPSIGTSASRVEPSSAASPVFASAEVNEQFDRSAAAATDGPQSRVVARVIEQPTQAVSAAPPPEALDRSAQRASRIEPVAANQTRDRDAEAVDLERFAPAPSQQTQPRGKS